MTNRLREIFGTRNVLCDGAMGTMLYARGMFINRCYDELNLSQPELVRTVHEEYLQAGAEIIETNTFGANALRLQRYGFATRCATSTWPERSWRARREPASRQAGEEAYVAGAVGPAGRPAGAVRKTGLAEARAAFAEQIRGTGGGRRRYADAGDDDVAG